MKNTVFIFTLLLLSSAFLVSRADGLDDVFNEAIKELEKHLTGESLSQEQKDVAHLKFIEGFLRKIIEGEIQLASLAYDPSNIGDLTSQQKSDLKKEVDGFIKVLFENKYSSLSDFIEKYKAENPTDLKDFFNNGKNKYADDLKQANGQQALVKAMISQLFRSSSTTEDKLTVAFNSIELLKPFLVQYKGISSDEIDSVIQFLKDSDKIRSSIQKLITRLADKDMRPKLLKLVLKYQTTKSLSESDILELLVSDPELMSIMIETDWQKLLKVQKQILEFGGKTYSDYINGKNAKGNKNNNNNNSNSNNKGNGYSLDEDQDDEEDSEQETKDDGSSVGMALLILVSVVALLGLIFVGVRKYRIHQIYNSGTDYEKRNLYQIQE